jgi:hypothetical protein
MSNALAIAATTATLRNLLDTQMPVVDADLSGINVVAQPLDQAGKDETQAKLNLFLYQTVINAAWRNMDMPRQVRPGETGSPPLALNLHYLITAYGPEDADKGSLSHRLLGAAMSVLHDHAVLDREEIRVALKKNDLADQFERLRITPLPLGVEEMSKLWMIFQTQYRISAAYEVTVVLIDSRAAVRSALPVLKRGQDGRGAVASASVAPNLKDIRLPRSQPAGRLGEDIQITGDQLTVTDATVRFVTSRVKLPVELSAQSGASAGEITVHLPNKTEDATALSRWAPGFYTVALVVKKTDAPSIVSNELAFALAPQITVTPNSAAVGTVNLTLTCEPRIAEGQRVLLLFGNRQVEPTSITTPADPAQPTTLVFAIPNVTVDSYVVRLRVDGADSIPVVYSGTPPVPAFDPLQTVNVHV